MPIEKETADPETSSPSVIEPAATDEKTPTTSVSPLPLEEESLLKRVHDRAFSGDSIEGTSQITPDPSEEAAAVAVPEEVVVQPMASPELVPVPISTDEPVLIQPDLQLEAVETMPLEPDVVIIADTTEETEAPERSEKVLSSSAVELPKVSWWPSST